MWRPEEWDADEIYTETESPRVGAGDYIEAGADAMLEAIIERLEDICENEKVSSMKNPSELEIAVENLLEELKKE